MVVVMRLKDKETQRVLKTPKSLSFSFYLERKFYYERNAYERNVGKGFF